MGLDLVLGGYFIYGYKISFSGIFYNLIIYLVNEDGILDYEVIKELVIKEKLKVIICGYLVYFRIVDFKKFREIVDVCGVKLMVDIVYIVGLIVGGVYLLLVFYVDIIILIIYKILRGVRGVIIMINDEEIVKKMNRWVFLGY